MAVAAGLIAPPWKILEDKIEQVYNVPNSGTHTLAIYQMITTPPGSVARFKGSIYVGWLSSGVVAPMQFGFWDVDFVVKTDTFSAATTAVGASVIPTTMAYTFTDGPTGTLTVDISTFGLVLFTVNNAVGGDYTHITFMIDVEQWQPT